MPISTQAEALQAWQNHLTVSGYSKHTIANYTYSVSRFLAQFPSPSALDVDAWLALMRQHHPLATLKNYAVALKSFFLFTTQAGLSTTNPASHVRLPRIPFRRRPAPVPQDVARLLALPLKPRSRALLYLLIDAGLRISEALSIRLVDVDFDARNVAVIGKGGDQRVVPLSPPTLDALELLLLTRPCSSSFLFPGQRALTWSRGAVNRHLAVLCRKAGAAIFTPHQLRHFFATEAINHGANIRAISEILGHKDPGITLRIYVHTDEELKRREHAAHSPLASVLRSAASSNADEEGGPNA